MSTVDWSKAPEGTTHFGPNHDFLVENWFKRDECGWSIWECARWAVCRGGLQKLREETMVQRPPQRLWDGQGLPAVGTVCEYKVLGGPWYRCEIRYAFFDGDDHSFVLRCPHLEFEQVARVCPDGSEGSVDFRPIRTPEQIAADERLHEVRNALTTIKAGQKQFPNDLVRGNITLSVVEAMIDAGYRKQVMP